MISSFDTLLRIVNPGFCVSNFVKLDSVVKCQMRTQKESGHFKTYCQVKIYVFSIKTKIFWDLTI